MWKMALALNARGVLPTLILVVALGPVLTSVCLGQAGLDMPGAETFKAVNIVGGERLILASGKLKSLEENVELEFIAASEKDENVIIKADRIDFFYAEEARQPTVVVAKGNVHFIMKTSKRELRADTATWSTTENKAEFRGSPSVVSEEGTLTGESVIHYFEDNRTVVKKPRGHYLIPEKKGEKEEEDDKPEEKKP